MPKIKYKELAAALRQDFGNDVANLDDLTLAQNWVNDNPDKADLIEFNVESPPTKRTGNLMEDLKSAPPLPRTKVAFQRERGGVEVPFIPQQFGFQGGEMVQPARPEIDESSLESPFVQVDSEPVIGRGTEILPTKFSNTIEGRNILDFTAGKKDPKSIEDYYKNIAKEGAVGSESDFGEEMRLANTIRVSEAFAADDYNENYPDAPLSFDGIKASLSNPEFANERNAAIDNINSTISKANWYGAMDLQDEYNQYAELANQLQADFDAKFGDFERSYAGYEQSVKKYGIPEAQGRLVEINERVLQQAKELDETNFFGKASLAASRFISGGGYLLSDFAGALGATDIADKMKSSLMDSQLATKDPRLALFKAPYDPKTGQFVEGGLLSANTLGFVFEQGLNMIPSIVAAATPYGRLGQLAVGAIGTAALTYDEYSAEIDQAALQAGAKIDPQTRAILSAVGAAKTGLIENAIPINRFFKNGMSKAFSENAVKALASGKSLDFAIKAGTQGIKAFGLTSGVEVAEELLDQGVQESINASITNQFPELKGQPQFEEKSLEDYAGIAVNTLVAVAPLGGVGFAYSGSRLKEDLFHNVARNNKVEVTLNLFEQNKDKFKDSQYKKNVDRLSLIGNIYSQIPEDIDDVSARKIADKMLEIESINSKMDKNTPQAIRERNTAKIDKINQEISSIFSEAEMSRPAVTEAPEEAFPTIELQIPESDQNVLNAVSERIEPIIAPLAQRMTNAEEIDMAEIEAVAEQMIDEQSRILESESLSETERQNLSDLIESQIDNLLNYEFATTTITEQAGQGIEVKGVVRAAKPGLPQKISAERFHGATITDPKTGEKRIVVLRRVPITQSRSGLVYQLAPKSFSGKLLSSPESQQVVSEEESKSTPFSNMEYVSSVFDDAGRFMGVILRDANTGEEIQLDNAFAPGAKSTQGETMGWNDLALDIAIAESQRQIGTVPEGAFIRTIQRVVPVEQVKKIFPNLRETGTAPEAAGVQPQTEQDVRQETNVTQERGDEGETPPRLPQEEGRQEGQVTPAVEGGAQAPPTAKKPVQEKPTTQPDVLKDVESTAKALEAAKEDDTVTFVDEIVNGEEGYRAVSKILDIINLAQRGDKRGNISIPSAIPFLPKTIKSVHLARNENDKRSILKNGFDEKQSSIDSPIPGVYFSSDDWSANDRFGREKKHALYVSIKNEGLVYFDDVASFADYLEKNNLPNRGQTLTQEQLNKLKSKGVKGILLREDFASDTRNELIVIDSSIIENISDNEIPITELPSSFSDSSKMAEAYHKAKKDGSNPELVKAVEDLLAGEQQQEKAEKPTTQPDTQAKSVKSSAQKAAKSLSNWVKGGESRGLGIANLPEQDAERFKKFTEDVGELISALINNGVTRASTALGMIKPYFAENGPQFSKYASRFFKDEFNLAIIDRYPDLYKKAQGLEKKLEKALTQKEKLLAKDVEEARNSIIEKIKLRLNPSSWSKAKSGILAKAKLTNESISELKLYSEIFNDESLSQMDGKELKALYNEINSIFKSGARSQSATNKILSNHNKSLKERSIIAISNSLGTSEKVNDYKSAEEKSKRPGVAFYIIDNESGQIQEVDRKNISEWKDFFESNSYSVIAIDTNRNTLRNKSLLGRLGKFTSKLKFDHLFDTRNIVAVFSNNDESYDFFEKNFIDLIWKADFSRDELKQQIGRFDKISEKLKNAGFNIDISKKVKSIVLRIGDVYAEGTNEDGLTIGQIIDTFMMLRDPDALVRAGGEGLVNYNKEDIDSIIDYVLNDEGLMRAVSEITQAYQDFLNEQILPTLTNYGYSTISFDPKQYNKNSSFSKNPDENARAIEILNKVYSNNIPQSIPYSPLSIVGDDAMIDESIDVLSSPNKDGVMSVMSNNVISRGDGGQIVFSNVAYKYNNYMDGMIDMVTRMPLLNNAKAMFGKEQMTLIKNKYGEAGADSIKSNVQRVVTNKSSKIEAKIIGEGVANWVNRSVLGQMWFNTRAALFQPIAALNFAPLAPSIGKYLSSVKSMNWISTTKEIQSMSWVKERFGGRIFSIDARELERRTKDGQIDIFSLVDKMLKIGYTPTAVFDFLSIVIGGGPLYDSIKNERYKEYIKTMDESSARIAAQNDASFELYKATNASQQSGNNMLISNAQRNPLLRLLMSYQTASQQMMRGAILSAQLLSKGIGDPARHAYIMLQFGLISTALFTLVSRTPELVYGALGFGDDDEDKDLKKSKRQKESESKYYTELLSGFFSGFGVPGNLMFAVGIKPFITDSFDQEKYDEVSAMEKFNMAVEKLSDYISAGAPGLSIKFRQFGDSAESFDEGEILRGIANAGSALAGIPLARLFEIFDQFAEAATRDYNAMERMLRATDIFNKSWSEKHYQEQVLKGKIEPKTKIEKNEIQKSNIEELNSMMKDLGFRAARQTGAERDKSLDKVKRYTDYAAREYSMTQDQYEGLVKNFNKGYFTGQVPDEFLDFARLSSESKVKAIAKKINSIDGLKERSNYIIRLDSANVGNDILSESEIEKVRNLLDDK